MNHMDKVYKALGLEMFEKFNMSKKFPNVFTQKIKEIKNPYYFTDEGIINKFGILQNDLLADLITGSMIVEKVN